MLREAPADLPEPSSHSLEPHPEEAEVVKEIFGLFVSGKQSPKAIANELNRPGGPPSPRHVDAARNLRSDWAG